MSKSVKIFLVIFIIIILIVLGYSGKKYYNNRYVGEDYYAQVPMDASTELEALYDDRGNEVDMGKEYELKAYNEKGEEQIAIFSVHEGLGQKVLEPGSYVKFSLSKTIVVKHQTIAKEEVPEKVLKILEEKKQ